MGVLTKDGLRYWYNKVLTRFKNITDGTTPVGNSNKLGGQLPEYYAKTDQLKNYLRTTGTAAKAIADADGNNIVNTYATKTSLHDYLSKEGGEIQYVKVTGASGDEGGEIQLVSPETNNDFAGDITVDVYKNSVRVFANHGNGVKVFNIDFSTMSDSDAIAIHSDNYTDYTVPKTGGKFTGDVVIEGGDITLTPTSDNPAPNITGVVGITASGQVSAGSVTADAYNGNRAAISGEVTAHNMTVGTDTKYQVHHDGNAAKVIISETEPEDKTALWIW